jgi:hypothetical protein
MCPYRVAAAANVVILSRVAGHLLGKQYLSSTLQLPIHRTYLDSFELLSSLATPTGL